AAAPPGPRQLPAGVHDVLGLHAGVAADHPVVEQRGGDRQLVRRPPRPRLGRRVGVPAVLRLLRTVLRPVLTLGEAQAPCAVDRGGVGAVHAGRELLLVHRPHVRARGLRPHAHRRARLRRHRRHLARRVRAPARQPPGPARQRPAPRGRRYGAPWLTTPPTASRRPASTSSPRGRSAPPSSSRSSAWSGSCSSCSYSPRPARRGASRRSTAPSSAPASRRPPRGSRGTRSSPTAGHGSTSTGPSRSSPSAASSTPASSPPARRPLPALPPPATRRPPTRPPPATRRRSTAPRPTPCARRATSRPARACPG